MNEAEASECIIIFASKSLLRLPFQIDMPPTQTVEYPADGHLTDVEYGGNFMLRSSGLAEIEDFMNLRFRQFVLGVPLTEQVASLLRHVGGIVCRLSQKQVVGIAASPVIAAMQDHHSFRNGADVSQVRKPVRPDLAARARDLDLAVAALGRGGPYPAVAGWINLDLCEKSSIQFIANHRGIIPLISATCLS